MTGLSSSSLDSMLPTTVSSTASSALAPLRTPPAPPELEGKPVALPCLAVEYLQLIGELLKERLIDRVVEDHHPVVLDDGLDVLRRKWRDL